MIRELSMSAQRAQASAQAAEVEDADGPTRMACASDTDASARAVLVATVRGRDTGANVLAHLLNARPDFQVRGFAAGAGWVHLAEFMQRWRDMRDKMTDPHNPDYIHFSQFHADPDDGVAPEVADTDFRALPELLRRHIKPAWYQFFNSSKVLCSMRRVVLEAQNPSRKRVFGFMHAFEDNGRAGVSGPPAHRAYGSVRALRSLDVFLALFPRGQIIVHLPFADVPDDASPMQHIRCMCPGEAVTCRSSPASATGPDRRLHMMRELRRYAHTRPSNRVMLTSASGDYRDLRALETRLSTFLRETPTPEESTREVDRMLRHWANTMRHDEVFDAVTLNDYVPRAGPSAACQRAAALSGAQATSDVASWCPPFRCGNTTGRLRNGGCTACPATLADWAWAPPVQSRNRKHRTPMVVPSKIAELKSKKPKALRSKQAAKMGDQQSPAPTPPGKPRPAHRSPSASRSELRKRGIRMYERLAEQFAQSRRARGSAGASAGRYGNS